ncbi:hypothetical protein DPMN_080252 [Dreissena polymorpha]|uniref:Uncharacterized protein n=1 Tax=Dreissena polymorpha TaxID=45954 RepID=A0A9D3YSB2_DREPO|nr:hypothetical protein DPMN_080252 [Dreissena polymorpha]
MAVGGHIGFRYFEAPGSVTDKHLGDLLCLRTNKLTSSGKISQPNFANGTSDLVLHFVSKHIGNCIWMSYLIAYHDETIGTGLEIVDRKLNGREFSVKLNLC